MIVGTSFKNDNNETLKNMQHEMYDYSISTIFLTVKHIYTGKSYSILYLTEDEIEKYRNIENCDHRLLQGTHDIIADVFRYKAQEGEFENDLFGVDNKQIENEFASEYTDTEFLLKIPKDYWHYASKWYQFLNKTIKENLSLVGNWHLQQ